jgi:hypothetical protein
VIRMLIRLEFSSTGHLPDLPPISAHVTFPMNDSKPSFLSQESILQRTFSMPADQLRK